MPNLLTDANRDRFLTVRWNNRLVGLLGFPALVFAGFALSSSTLSARSAFIGLVVIGVFY